MIKPIVYTKSNCMACNFTKKWLIEHNVEFTSVNIEDNETAKLAVKEMGYQAVPVIVVGDEHWHGFQPDKLTTLVQNNE